ncbi:hypothetical protein ABE66_17815 [Cytobacillus firmus]|nr:hypothetical protein [Cytobacillus firmus]
MFGLTPGISAIQVRSRSRFGPSTMVFRNLSPKKARALGSDTEVSIPKLKNIHLTNHLPSLIIDMYKAMAKGRECIDE